MDSLEMPQGLQCTLLQNTPRAIHSEVHQTQEANLIRPFPLLVLFNTFWWVSRLWIAFSAHFLPSCSLPVNLQHCFLTSSTWSDTEQQCFGSMCCFFISRDFETSFTFVSLLSSPPSLTLFIYPSLISVWEGNPQDNVISHSLCLKEQALSIWKTML